MAPEFRMMSSNKNKLVKAYPIGLNFIEMFIYSCFKIPQDAGINANGE